MSILKTGEEWNWCRGKDTKYLAEYERFSMYVFQFKDDLCNPKGFDVLSGKAKWSCGFWKINLADGRPVQRLQPIFVKDAFRDTGVEEKMVVSGEGGVDAEILHSLEGVGEVHFNHISVF